jgi:glycosyltransferase involved in cell wall biosynthesis
MLNKPKVSIVINNYNYDRFLADAIESAIHQTYTNIEVIVVDDGSTDNSRDIISVYGNQIIPILKQNGGQTSALNAGIEVSRGEIIFFLDADDIFIPNKVEEMVQLFAQVTQDSPDAMISNYIETINEVGKPIDNGILDNLRNAYSWDYLHEIRGERSILGEDLMMRLSTPEQAFNFAAKYRFIPFLAMPTSGFAMTSSLAKKVFPIPCNKITSSIGADEFVVKGASLLGTVYLANSVLTKYRIHGKNSDWHWSKDPIKIKEFIGVVDDFLNSKLKSIGKKTVFSQLNSIQSKGFFREHYGSDELLELATNVIKWHVNTITLNFFIKTTILAIMLKFRHILNVCK